MSTGSLSSGSSVACGRTLNSPPSAVMRSPSARIVSTCSAHAIEARFGAPVSEHSSHVAANRAGADDRDSHEPSWLGDASPLDLPGRSHGDLAHDAYTRRQLEADEPIGAVPAQLGQRDARGHDDGGLDSLPVFGVRHAAHHRFPHNAVGKQQLVDVARSYLRASAVDELLDPADQRQVAVIQANSEIPGPERAVAEGSRVGLRVRSALGWSGGRARSKFSNVASMDPMLSSWDPLPCARS